jgi:hypothetical protein
MFVEASRCLREQGAADSAALMLVTHIDRVDLAFVARRIELAGSAHHEADDGTAPLRDEAELLRR